jgi:micrococcal nuclease
VRGALPTVLTAVAVAVAAPGCAGADLAGGAPGAGAQGEPRRVTRVADGDTLVLGRERVRLIGVDTPELARDGAPAECFGPAAHAYTRRFAGGERVRLELDAERRDRFGRLLAYVRRARDGAFLNAALVRDGYATPLSIAPNDRYAGRLRRLARRARAAGRGLWSACEGT